MNIGFFGSPSFAKEIVDGIQNQYCINYVVTQPSKPVGRTREIIPTAIYSHAKKIGIPVFTPEDLTHFNLPPTDIAIVAAYGKIIPEKLLTQATHGFFNVHYSLLPHYRGASPVQYALINGDKETGVTLFQLTKELDCGPITSQTALAIDSTVSAGTLINQLTRLSIQPVLDLLSFIKNNHALPKLTVQTDKPTYTRTLAKNDGFIPLETLKKIVHGQPVQWEEYPQFIAGEITSSHLTMQPCNPFLLHNFVRGLNPWPIAWTKLSDNKRLRIFETAITENTIQFNAFQLEGRRISTDSKFINRFFQ